MSAIQMMKTMNQPAVCPKCSKRVIDRQGYIGQYVINELDDNGVYPYCHYPFEELWHEKYKKYQPLFPIMPNGMDIGFLFWQYDCDSNIFHHFNQ
jgi:hypothetical protein